MTRLRTVEQTKKKIAKFQVFIDLVDEYHPETLEQQLGGEVKVSDKTNSLGYTRTDGQPFESADITAIITGKGNDELHKFIRSGNLRKTRHTRTKNKR